MKKNVLRFLLLFFSLHYGITQLIPSVYLPEELLEWTNKIELFIKTGLTERPTYSSAAKSCPMMKPHNDYVFEIISSRIHEVWNELESQRKIYQLRRAALAYVQSHKKYRIYEKMSEIRRAFKDLTKRLPVDMGSLDKLDLCSYTSSQLTVDPLQNKIDSLFDEIVKDSGSGALSAIAGRFKPPNEELCDRWTPNAYIYSIYAEVLMTEMAGYITTLYSYWYLYKYDGSNGCRYPSSKSPDHKVKELRAGFRKRILAYTEKFLLAMENVFHIFIKCTPADNKRDETFIELEGAVQTVPLPDIYYARQCAEIDMKSGVEWNHYCKMYPSNFQCLGIRRPCRGHISKCKPRPSGEVCLDNFQSPRRYKWIATEYSGQGACPKQHLISMSYGGRANCICRCVDNQPNSKSVHIFNLQNVEADVKENKVVTGVRILVDHKIVHLQIKQGTLVRNWQVKNSDWKPINDISEEIRAHRLGKEVGSGKPNVKANVDYLVISEDQPVNLDTLLVPHNHVLTGVKFHYGADNHLQVAILTRPFNSATGKLYIADGSNIVTSPKKPRSKYGGGWYPTRSLGPLVKYKFLTGEGYIVMTESNLETDSGQSTVPFFDAQPVESNPASIMGGLDFLYQGHDNFGFGFFSLELIAFDYQAYMNESWKFLTNVPDVPLEGQN